MIECIDCKKQFTVERAVCKECSKAVFIDRWISVKNKLPDKTAGILSLKIAHING